MTMVTIKSDPAAAGHATSAGAEPYFHPSLPTRTLLEAENTRLQTPGLQTPARSAQASLGFPGKRRSQLLPAALFGRPSLGTISLYSLVPTVLMFPV